MPWVRASLRGQVVYAETTEAGQLALQGGRVEIRFKAGGPGEEPPFAGKKYLAAAQNLALLAPGSTEDVAAEKAEQQAKAKPARKPSVKPSPSASAAGLGEVAGEAPSSASAGPNVLIYTDGACTGNPGPAGLGVVVVGEDENEELSEYLGHGTYNIAELTAILRGVELAAERPGRLLIHTDSQYSIGVLQKGWKAKANTELIEKIRAVLRKRGGVELRYVKGHAGIPLNERCDELARAAVVGRRTEQRTVKNAAARRTA